MPLTQEQIENYFGKFIYTSNNDGSIKIISKDFLSKIVPFVIKHPKGKILWYCHEKIYFPLQNCFNIITLKNYWKFIDYEDTRKNGGCFVPRHTLWDKTKKLSTHSWGIAFDINPSTNPFGKPPTLAPEIVEVFERNYFEWGGRWKKPDGMHFEYTKIH